MTELRDWVCLLYESSLRLTGESLEQKYCILFYRRTVCESFQSFAQLLSFQKR